MPKSTELSLHPHTAQIIVQALTRLVATFAIVQGINIFLGGFSRWSAEQYKTALLLLGAPPTWATVILIFGTMALVGSLRGKYTPVVVGMYGICTWCVFFAISFVISAFQSPTSATTGIFTQGTVAVVAGALAVAYRLSHNEAR